MTCTCHRCGADYEGSEDEKAFVSKWDWLYDPTDFTCPSCLKAEEEAFDAFIESQCKEAKERLAIEDMESLMHDHWYNE